MSSSGGGIVIHGKNAAGVEGGGSGNVSQTFTSAAIALLANNGGTSTGSPLYPVWNALTSALAFSQT